MRRAVIGMALAVATAPPTSADCEKSSEWLRRYVTLEAASQAACLGHPLSPYRDLGYGAVMRIAKEIDLQSCHLEIMTSVSSVKDEIASKGADFCKWATEARDSGYGSYAPWPK